MPPPNPMPERLRRDAAAAAAAASASLIQHPKSPSSPTSHRTTTTTSRYRALALDLDGTLLQSNHQLSQTTIEYLQYLYDHRNVTIIFATGRAAPSTYEHILNLNLDLPLVCSNGASGMICRIGANDEQNQQTLLCEPLFYTPVPRPVVLRTIGLARRLGNHIVQYYHGDTICANATTPFHFQLMKRYTEMTGSPVQVSTDDFAKYLQQDQLPSKLLVLFPDDCGGEVFNAFQKELGATQQATIVRGSDSWFVEVLHPEVSKGHGLARMLEHLNIPISQCVAFGDSDNDMEFLQMAGLGIAMLNAKPNVLDIADQITDWTNDEDGVIRTLQEMEDRGMLA